MFLYALRVSWMSKIIATQTEQFPVKAMCLSFNDTEELHALTAGNWHFLGLNFISSHFSLFSAFYLQSNKAPFFSQFIVGLHPKGKYKQVYCCYVSCMLEGTGGWLWKVFHCHWPFYKLLGRRIKMHLPSDTSSIYLSPALLFISCVLRASYLTSLFPHLLMSEGDNQVSTS